MKKTSFIFVFTQGTVLHRTNFVTVVLMCGKTLNVKYPLCFWSWLQSKFMANKFLLSMSWQVPDCVCWFGKHSTLHQILSGGWKFTQIAKWWEAIWLNVAAYTSEVQTLSNKCTAKKYML